MSQVVMSSSGGKTTAVGGTDAPSKKGKEGQSKQKTVNEATGGKEAAKLSKEEKKRQKAERRSQKKAEAGKTGQSSTVVETVGQHKRDITRDPKQQQQLQLQGGSSGSSSASVSTASSTESSVKSLIGKRSTRERSISWSEDSKKVQLFSHLHQYERDKSLTRVVRSQSSNLPSSLVRLGTLYSSGVICGSNARCLAMLGTFKMIIQDYSTPEQKHLSRDLGHTIKPYINFLTASRPLSVSMGNSIKWLKLAISNIPLDTNEAEAKKVLCEMIDEYIREKIILADSAIADACRKGIIKNGDVILTYAHSSVVMKSLIDAHAEGIRFKVIVVDSRPKLEGQYALKRLTNAGIPCSYIYINAVSYIMKEVSKVLIGAHAVLANGYVMSRVGTSLIALVARSYNVPVLVCCETYKFCDKVQTDAFVLNELGDPNDLVSINRHQGNILSNWKALPSLGLLNLAYDVTSPNFVTMVITEVGNIPCTSVPVILRLIHNNLGLYNTTVK